MHWLRPAGAEIDDGEPTLTQRHTAFRFDPNISRIRPAMPDALDHRFADRAQRIGRRGRAPIDHAGNAAHRASSETDGRSSLQVTRFPLISSRLLEELALLDIGMRRVALDHRAHPLNF